MPKCCWGACLLRRRDEGAPVTPVMRATALYLGLVMKMNFEGVGVKHWEAPGAGPDQSSSDTQAPAPTNAPQQVGRMCQATIDICVCGTHACFWCTARRMLKAEAAVACG